MEAHKTARSSGRPGAQKRKRAEQSSSAQSARAQNKRQCLTESVCLSSPDDIKVMNSLNSRYEVLLQSVISSSKIQQRVSAILHHLTPSAQSPDAPAPKTRVSVLRAKATEAGKLVSIAEIAKREIEKEQSATSGEAGHATGSQTGRWYQYITLGEELQERKRTRDETIVEETVIGGQATDKDEDDEFELMKTPFERALEGRPVLRGIPVMSLFLSRSPIEDLKKRYGEQTNALPVSF